MDEVPVSESYFSFIWRFHLSPAARRGTFGSWGIKVISPFELIKSYFTFWAHQFVDGHVDMVLVTM